MEEKDLNSVDAIEVEPISDDDLDSVAGGCVTNSCSSSSCSSQQQETLDSGA